jgi:hypothetical protein
MIDVITANYPKLGGNDFQLLKSNMGGPGKPLIAVAVFFRYFLINC